MASVNGISLGRAIADLVRRALESVDTPRLRNGAPLMPSRGPVAPKITTAFFDELLDEE